MFVIFNNTIDADSFPPFYTYTIFAIYLYLSSLSPKNAIQVKY